MKKYSILFRVRTNLGGYGMVIYRFRPSDMDAFTAFGIVYGILISIWCCSI